jgi:hypothetical protein
MSEDSVENSGKAKQSTHLEQFEALEIPPDIDPKLLNLWLEREREEFEKEEKQKHTLERVERGRNLCVLFAAFIGITVMCFAIVLGFIQQKDPTEILVGTCKVFLIYSIIGFVIGWVADTCVRESVEVLLREILRRNQDRG